MTTIDTTSSPHALPRASFGYSVHREPYREWWGVWLEDGTYRFVCVEMDLTWARNEASINDVKALAIEVARKA
jgi:hypothetical protein